MLKPKNEEYDYKLFKKMLPLWQEEYISKRLSEYNDIINNNDEAPSYKYWSLYKIVNDDKKNPGVIINDPISRSNYKIHILNLIDHKIITVNDLDEFSDNLKDFIKKSINS